jgi:hypothetical protein
MKWRRSMLLLKTKTRTEVVMLQITYPKLNANKEKLDATHPRLHAKEEKLDSNQLLTLRLKKRKNLQVINVRKWFVFNL